MKTSNAVTQRARNLRKNQTGAEQLLWRHLRNLPEYKFRRQLPLGPYIVDFACLSRKLILELDGGQHAETVHADEERSRFLAAEGFRVLRFWNSEVFGELDAVLEKIVQSLG